MENITITKTITNLNNKFYNCTINKINLSNKVINDVIFENCVITNVVLDNCDIYKCFKNCEIVDANVFGNSYGKFTFNGSTITNLTVHDNNTEIMKNCNVENVKAYPNVLANTTASTIFNLSPICVFKTDTTNLPNTLVSLSIPHSIAISSSLSSLTNLTALNAYISSNHSGLPTTLKRLDYKGDFSLISSLTNLNSLIYLGLHENTMSSPTYLSKYFNNCTNLNEVYLGKTFNVKMLYYSFENLYEMTKIYSEDNTLEEINAAFTGETNLKQIRFGKNFYHLGQSFTLATNIETLDLTDTNLNGINTGDEQKANIMHFGGALQRTSFTLSNKNLNCNYLYCWENSILYFNILNYALYAGTALWAGGKGYEDVDVTIDSLYSIKPLSRYIEENYYDPTYSNILLEQYGCNNSLNFNTTSTSRRRLTSLKYVKFNNSNTTQLTYLTNLENLWIESANITTNYLTNFSTSDNNIATKLKSLTIWNCDKIEGAIYSPFRGHAQLTSVSYKLNNMTALGNDMTGSGSGYLRDSFCDCSSLEVINLELPKCQLISAGAFARCYQLSHLDLRGCPKLNKFGYRCFDGASKLKDITFEGLTQFSHLDRFNVKSSLFANCSSLQHINFSGCSSLTGIAGYIFNGLSALEDICFDGCSKINYIGDSCFKNCNKLTMLDLSATTELTHLDSKAFPTSLRYIKTNIPANRSNLSELYLNVPNAIHHYLGSDIAKHTYFKAEKVNIDSYPEIYKRTIETSNPMNYYNLTKLTYLTDDKTKNILIPKTVDHLTLPNLINTTNFISLNHLRTINLNCKHFTTTELNDTIRDLTFSQELETLEIENLRFLKELDLTNCTRLTNLIGPVNCINLTKLLIPSSVVEMTNVSEDCLRLCKLRIDCPRLKSFMLSITKCSPIHLSRLTILSNDKIKVNNIGLPTNQTTLNNLIGIRQVFTNSINYEHFRDNCVALYASRANILRYDGKDWGEYYFGETYTQAKAQSGEYPPNAPFTYSQSD